MRTPKDNAYQFIKNALGRERAMRQRFLSGERREKGIQEIDDCLKALDILHTPTPTEQPAKQESLFA